MCRIVYLLFICSFLWVSVDSWTKILQAHKWYEDEEDQHVIPIFQRYEDIRIPDELECEDDSFQCNNNKKCISDYMRCNDIIDCEDGSDEEDCDEYRQGLPITCASGEFQCKNKKECIPEHKFCDDVPDCIDKSDEFFDCQKQLNCTNKFHCKNGFCVRKEWVCDGMKDCSDNSDEMNCETIIPESDCNSANNRFLCKNKRCISINVVCNSIDNCGDVSDEGGNCTATALCASKNCQYCKLTPTGPVCTCTSGYKLQDNNTCIDIDECQIYGICDQECKNLPGSYNCFCHPDYSLQDDKKTCKADGGEATLLFSTRTSICGYYLDSQIYFDLVKSVNHVHDIVANGDYLYWTEVNNDNSVIKRINTRTHEKREDVVTGGLKELTSLTVDWITGNIYFTDTGYSHIGVCNYKGTYCTVLINSYNPKELVLVPAKGLMYYTEDRFISCDIKMVGMDGNNTTTLTHQYSSVLAMAIDYPNNRLYWLSEEGNIKSIKLDGTDRRVILESIVQNALSFTVFENKLYWSNEKTKSIQSCNKFSGKDWKTLIHASDDVPYCLHIDHSVVQFKVSNPCHTNPCSELCLLNPNETYTCACSMNKKLDANRHTCRDAKKRQHLVIIAGNTFINYYHEVLGNPKVTTSVLSNHITEAIYDQLTGTILAIDQHTHYVIRYDPKTGSISNLISIKDIVVADGGMAFDYIGNNVYLSNIERKSIEVHSLKTMEKTIFYFNEEPHCIETVPTQGIMYVVFKEFSDTYFRGRIDRMNMNGLGKRETVHFLYTYQLRSLIHYDSHENTLLSNSEIRLRGMWFHAKYRLTFESVPSSAVSFATTEDNIFWTERNSKVLYWKDKAKQRFKNSKNIALTMPVDKVEIPLLIYLSGIVVQKEEGCLQNNGNCSHVCLPSSPPPFFICACPPKMILSANNRTCIAQTACPMHEIKCSEHDICIKQEQWCNGNPDCPNGEDEENNCKERGICEENEFMCNDKTCISANKHCNFHDDCPDMSDEIDCSRTPCSKGQYQCREGQCIPLLSVCDGTYDCPDFSDELYCDTHTCASTDFMCEMGKCIPKQWKCDGENDCPDDSDEAGNCHLSSVCGPDHYECSNKRCISTPLKCNGINDCGDNSDEKYCMKNFRNCTKDEYACVNSDLCIPKKKRCDGTQDCPRKDDEYHCAICEENQFRCNNQLQCISNKYVCDKMDDCDDKSDETDCNSLDKKNIKDCSNQQFKCINGTCLSFNKVCDGIKDCFDGDDELGNCSIACDKAECKDLCHNTPQGAVCGCQAGYSLDSKDKISCNDIDECQQNFCSQTCENIMGSFKCSCLDGYSLRSDKISCKAIGPQMQFVVATEEDIRNISSNIRYIKLVHQFLGSGINSIDSNALDDAIYWSSEEAGTINKINIKTQEILTTGNMTPGAIAVDWITNNIYFNDDSHPNVIKVCNLEQLKCAIVTEIKSTAKVTALIVDPIKSYLFWSQTVWQPLKNPMAEIYRTNLMGGDMKKIVFWNISVISGMAIDYTRSKLYWSDSNFNTIESSNLDGDNRTTFLNTHRHQPVSINIFEDSLYWLMASNGHLQKCKLYGTEKTCTVIDIGAHNVHKYFTIFHIAKHPIVENLCKTQHCDYMCVLTSNGTACICQDGKPVKPNDICPKNANDEIIVASRMSSMKSAHTRHEGGVYSTVIVVILVVGALSGVYYFYQRYRFKLSVSHSNSFDSIRFQNPSFDRKDEVAVTLSSTSSSNICPGQHEYMNPVTDKLIEAAKESSLRRLKESSSQLERENPEMGKDTSLIHFGLSQ